MRKLLSILLLAIFALPLASPLLANETQDDAGLPACCRRNGAHHCSGMDTETSAVSPERPRVYLALQRCPRFPAALVAVHPSPFVPRPSESVFVAIATKQIVNQQMVPARNNPADSAYPKRGPPTFL